MSEAVPGAAGTALGVGSCGDCPFGIDDNQSRAQICRLEDWYGHPVVITMGASLPPPGGCPYRTGSVTFYLDLER